MTNELLSYIKDAVYAVLFMLVLLSVINLTAEQLGAIGTAVVAVGALAIRINTVRSGGAVQALRTKATAAEDAGLVTSDGPPPEGDE